jgi:hypothetical protein
VKTYSSLSGYVYQYYFDGARELEGCKEYRFQAATDAKTFWSIFVRIPRVVVLEWEKSAGRDLNSNELYGVAKLLLFQHLDDVDPARAPGSAVTLARPDLDRISEQLGID